MGEICGGGAAKNPNGLAGGVVLAGINVDEQLRVRYPPPRKGKRRPLKRRNFVS